MPRALTEAEIERAVASKATARRELSDTVEPGLRLRLGAREATWSLQTHGMTGKRIRVSIGTWPELSLKAARSCATALRRSLRPTEPSTGEEMTLDELLGIYKSRRLVQLRKGHAVGLSLERGLRPLLGRQARSVTRRDIGEALDQMAQSAPVHANRCLAYAKAMFNWSLGRGYLEANPAVAVQKPTRERARERTPTLQELRLIWLAADRMQYPFGPVVQLLILTAARRDEVGAMRRVEVHLPAGNSEGVWTLPAERSKNGVALRIPLSPLARRLVEAAMKRSPAGSQFIFSTGGDRPVSGWSRAKRRLDKLIEAALGEEGSGGCLPPWRFHDLRRAFATQACDALGIDPVVADRCLNHVGSSTRSTVARVYGRSELFEPRRQALARWALLVEEQVIGPREASEAV